MPFPARTPAGSRGREGDLEAVCIIRVAWRCDSSVARSSVRNITADLCLLQCRSPGRRRDERCSAGAASGAASERRAPPVYLRGTDGQGCDLPPQRVSRIVRTLDVIDREGAAQSVAISIRHAPDRKATQHLAAPDREMERGWMPPRAPQQRLPVPPTPTRRMRTGPGGSPHGECVLIAFRQPEWRIDQSGGQGIVARERVCDSSNTGIPLLGLPERSLGHR
jgi:hypothetical protein